jgi:hypothetical protein
MSVRAALNVRRFFDQRLPLGSTRITSANVRAHIDLAAVPLAQQRANASERFLQIFANIVAQRFERRHVNDSRFIRQFGLDTFAEQRIQRSKKRRQRFARACRGGN